MFANGSPSQGRQGRAASAAGQLASSHRRANHTDRRESAVSDYPNDNPGCQWGVIKAIYIGLLTAGTITVDTKVGAHAIVPPAARRLT